MESSRETKQQVWDLVKGGQYDAAEALVAKETEAGRHGTALQCANALEQNGEPERAFNLALEYRKHEPLLYLGLVTRLAREGKDSVAWSLYKEPAARSVEGLPDAMFRALADNAPDSGIQTII